MEESGGQRDTLRRVVVERAGGYDQLRLVDATAVPRPGPLDVLVEVIAFGVNYADVCVRMGLYASAARYVGWPITPGRTIYLLEIANKHYYPLMIFFEVFLRRHYQNLNS